MHPASNRGAHVERWNDTTDALPAEDEVVQFVLNERAQRLRGVYREGAFQSRWWSYPVDDVAEWSRLAPDAGGFISDLADPSPTG